MIKQTLFLMLGIGFILSSCKKHGCTDSSAVNYSNIAKKDDGSCFYKSDLNNVNSAVYNIYSWEWAGDGDGYSVTKSSDIITADIATNGIVLCYFKIGNDYLQIPYSAWSGNTWTSHYIFAYTTGAFSLLKQDDDGLTMQPDDAEIKIVVASKMAISVDTDLSNYKEVAKELNLD